MQEKEDSRAQDGLSFELSRLDNLSGLDVERGLDVFEGDVEDYISALHSFLKNTPAVIDKLRDVTEDALPGYAVNIHGLKSISAWICAERIQAGAAELEALAKAGDLSGVVARNDKFLKDAEALIKDLQVVLEDDPPE